MSPRNRDQSAPATTEGNRGESGDLLKGKVRAFPIQATSNPTIAPIQSSEGKLKADAASFNRRVREVNDHADEIEELLEEIRAAAFEGRGAEL